MTIIQSWDTAIKAGAGRDYSACVVVRIRNSASLSSLLSEEGKNSQRRGRVHQIIHVWRGRVEYPELKRQVIALAEQFRPEGILIEDKASGQSLIQDVRRETTLPIIPVMPRGDKVTRFAAVTPMIEAGQVALPTFAGWLAEFEQEILAFPNGAHDDQVDALSQYLNWAREREYDGLQIRRL